MSKGTPHRAIRIPEELWDKLKAKAEKEGTDASAVIRKLVEEWVDKGKPFM